LGHRLGVPASAEPGTLVEAVASATGHSQRQVHQLLYGPVPDSNRSLADLASQLDHLESEVSHR
ncbi:MAG: Secreted protein, partial [Actinomyces urogenitalis DORA_12]